MVVEETGKLIASLSPSLDKYETLLSVLSSARMEAICGWQYGKSEDAFMVAIRKGARLAIENIYASS